MQVKEVSCCALQCITQANTLAAGVYGKAQEKQFDALCTQGHGKGDGYQGQYITATIVALRHDAGHLYEPTITRLKAKGWKHLGTFPGAHGNYKMELWGSEAFTVPRRKT